MKTIKKKNYRTLKGHIPILIILFIINKIYSYTTNHLVRNLPLAPPMNFQTETANYTPTIL